MAKYGLVDPFELNEEEMKHLSREECFALGVEWALFRQRLNEGEPFGDYVLQDNRERLVDLAQRRGRKVSFVEADGGWVFVTVGDPND